MDKANLETQEFRIWTVRACPEHGPRGNEDYDDYQCGKKLVEPGSLIARYCQRDLEWFRVVPVGRGDG